MFDWTTSIGGTGRGEFCDCICHRAHGAIRHMVACCADTCTVCKRAINFGYQEHHERTCGKLSMTVLVESLEQKREAPVDEDETRLQDLARELDKKSDLIHRLKNLAKECRGLRPGEIAQLVERFAKAATQDAETASLVYEAMQPWVDSQ